MARLTSDFAFTGSLGNVSAYKMRGSDKIILRRKGGPSKKQIKTGASFDLVRRNNAEFGGRSVAAKWIVKMLQPQKSVADHNILASLNALLKPIQTLDTESKFGKRNVMLSRNPGILEGFSLNRKHHVESIIRTSLSCALSRENLSASVHIPELLPGINFYSPWHYPMYSIVVTLGIVPDLIFDDLRYQPLQEAYSKINMQVAVTDWCPVVKGSSSTILALAMNSIPPDQSFSLMLSIGIRFGILTDIDRVEQVKYAGSAKILAMG